jgi:hypothetical protein
MNILTRSVFILSAFMTGQVCFGFSSGPIKSYYTFNQAGKIASDDYSNTDLQLHMRHVDNPNLQISVWGDIIKMNSNPSLFPMATSAPNRSILFKRSNHRDRDEQRMYLRGDAKDLYSNGAKNSDVVMSFFFKPDAESFSPFDNKARSIIELTGDLRRNYTRFVDSSGNILRNCEGVDIDLFSRKGGPCARIALFINGTSLVIVHGRRFAVINNFFDRFPSYAQQPAVHYAFRFLSNNTGEHVFIVENFGKQVLRSNNSTLTRDRSSLRPARVTHINMMTGAAGGSLQGATVANVGWVGAVTNQLVNDQFGNVRTLSQIGTELRRISNKLSVGDNIAVPHMHLAFEGELSDLRIENIGWDVSAHADNGLPHNRKSLGRKVIDDYRARHCSWHPWAGNRNGVADSSTVQIYSNHVHTSLRYIANPCMDPNMDGVVAPLEYSNASAILMVTTTTYPDGTGRNIARYPASLVE